MDSKRNEGSKVAEHFFPPHIHVGNYTGKMGNTGQVMAVLLQTFHLHSFGCIGLWVFGYFLEVISVAYAHFYFYTCKFPLYIQVCRKLLDTIGFSNIKRM